VGRGSWGCGLERVLCPLPRKFFDFEAQNGEFWCILGALVTVSCLFYMQKLVLLGLENLQLLHAVHCRHAVQQNQKANMPVGNSRVKIILYVIRSKML